MANEKRLIDANSRIEEIKKAYCTNCDNYNGIKCRSCWVDDAIWLIDDAHTVDAVEAVRGRWKFLDIDGWWFDECSICGNTTPNRDGSPPDWNYCPDCGAKMDGGNEDG